jgi:hypothetical protein
MLKVKDGRETAVNQNRGGCKPDTHELVMRRSTVLEGEPAKSGVNDRKRWLQSIAVPLAFTVVPT